MYSCSNHNTRLLFLLLLLLFRCHRGVDGASLLWHYLSDGKPAIFDPAVYYGHSEADFGIMRMFGGVTSDFYDAYFEVGVRVLYKFYGTM